CDIAPWESRVRETYGQGRRRGQETLAEQTGRRRGQETLAEQTGRRRGQETLAEHSRTKRKRRDPSRAALLWQGLLTLPPEQTYGRGRRRGQETFAEQEVTTPEAIASPISRQHR